MARGNQRQIDRERARKRNADKGGDNKRDQKSDYVANKEKYQFFEYRHAEIMREKQKKHEQKEE